jgi:hypothetical protein
LVVDVKKPRRSRKAVTPVVEVPSSSSAILTSPARPPSTIKQSRIVKQEQADDGADAEVEDETTPVRVFA